MSKPVNQLNHTKHANPFAQLTQISLVILMLVALLSLSACQSRPSVVEAKPAKPIMTIPSTSEGNTAVNSADKVIFIDTPPPIVPTLTPVSVNNPNDKSSQDKAAILTAPSQSHDEMQQPANSALIIDTSKQVPSTNQDNTSNTQLDNTSDKSTAINTQSDVNTSDQPTTNATDSTQSETTQQPVTAPVVNIREPDRRTPQEILLERARANTNSQAEPSAATIVLENGDNVPAFRRLMQTGIGQLQNGDYNSADSTFTRAQRLAPQSASVYYYLGQVALKRNQPKRSEAMARRGLVVVQTNAMRKQLWQVILSSGEIQQSPRVITEAQTALGAL